MIIFVLLFKLKTTTKILFVSKTNDFSNKMLYLFIKIINLVLINYAKLLKTPIQKTVFIVFDR